MTTFKGIRAAILLITLFAGTASVFAAGNGGPRAGLAEDDSLYQDSSEVNSMMTKLGRGTCNLFGGWLEIPRQIGKTCKTNDAFTGFVIGSFKGCGWTIARTVSGAFEVLTFPFPIPKDYEPVIKPEYIFKSVYGAPMPIVSDRNSNAWEGMENPGLPESAYK